MQDATGSRKTMGGSIKTSLVQEICQPLISEVYQASKRGQSKVEKLVEDIDRLVERSDSVAQSSRANYDQVVVLMQTARNLRRRASSALKVVDELDEAATEEGEDKAALKATRLQEAAKSVEAVESQARTRIGCFIGEDEGIAAFAERSR